MDHVVYLDAAAKEFDKLFRGVKTHIIRGAAGRKLPYGRVFEGDTLYFINNNGEGAVKAKATVKNVIQSDKMEKEESVEMVEKYADQLRLSKTQTKRWAGKRYLVLIEIQDFERIESIVIDKSDYENMDDWLPVGDIHNVTMI